MLFDSRQSIYAVNFVGYKKGVVRGIFFLAELINEIIL